MRTLVVIVLGLSATLSASGEEDAMPPMPKTGTFWYRMEDEGGQPMGYGKLVVSVPEAGGLHADWVMKLAFTGGTYEEERRFTLDKDLSLVAAAYVDGERKVSSGAWSAEKPAPANAATAVIFLYATMVPLEAGGVLVRRELNEAKDFADLGETKFTFEAKEEDGTHRVRMARQDGQGMPIWVTDDRAVARIDWGGGTIMRLSPESTEHLFKPAPPVVREVESQRDRLTLTGDFPKFTPAEIFDHFVKPDLLAKWWPPQAEVDLKDGGVYKLTWPGQWTLDGRILAFTTGEHLVFSWRWEHDPKEDRHVEVVCEPLDGGGTRLWVIHSPYEAGPEEASARRGHKQGWEFFLAKLAALRP